MPRDRQLLGVVIALLVVHWVLLAYAMHLLSAPRVSFPLLPKPAPAAAKP